MNRNWWLILGIGVFLLFAYLTRGVLLPFLAGLAVAYLLDPVADWLEEKGVGRGLASVLILVVFFFAIVGLILSMWPLLQSQIIGLVNSLPDAIRAMRPLVEETLASLSDEYQAAVGQDAEQVVTSIAQKGLERLSGFVGTFVSQGLALFSLLGLLLITPVVAFYLLRDYDRLIDALDRLLPPDYEPVIKEQLTRVDKALSGFVRGQILICSVMGAIYAAGWSAVGLNFGLVLGILGGIMAFIPFVGMLFAAIVALIMAFAQFGADPVKLGLVAGVWIFVQGLEGTFLTPKLVGERVGLHPVWVLFAVFAGGEVAGFVGVLLAVPMAAVIGVLVRFGVSQYLASHGQEDTAEQVASRGLLATAGNGGDGLASGGDGLSDSEAKAKG